MAVLVTAADGYQVVLGLGETDRPRAPTERCQVNSAAGSEIRARRSQAAAAASAQASFAALRKARRVSRLIR